MKSWTRLELNQQLIVPSLLIIIVSLIAIVNSVVLFGDHICHRNESYTALEPNKTVGPVRIRDYEWCLGFPPRCSKYRTEIKEIIKYQNVTKTRVVAECCDGYVERRTKESKESAECVPKCPNNCVYGVCSKPHFCECNTGYEGITCSKTCDKGKWGKNCNSTCDCPSYNCDPVSGVCVQCIEGWTGIGCSTKCSKGFFGRDCASKCDNCPGHDCDFKTGDCLHMETTSESTIMTSSEYTSTSPVPTTTLRPESSTIPSTILATTSTEQTVTSSVPESTTNHMVHIHRIDEKSSDNSKAITALNTTVANLESNVKNLEKQVDEHKKIIVTSSTTETISLHLLEISTAPFPQVLIPSNDQPEVVQPPPQNHYVEIQNEPPQIVVLHNSVLNAKDLDRTTQLDQEIERRSSAPMIIMIVVLILLICIVMASIGYFWHRKRSNEDSKLKPHVTELQIIDKPLPEIPPTEIRRSGSVKSVTFDDHLTYYGVNAFFDDRVKGSEYHVYDEVTYPSIMSLPRKI